MKSFDEIYNKMQETLKEPMEEKRKASRNRILIVSIILISVGLYLSIEFAEGYYGDLVNYTPLALAVILIICYKKGLSKKTKQYEKSFKENVIGMLVKEYCETLEYEPNGELPFYAYLNGEFENYDIIHYEDLITGTLNKKYKIMMAEVNTEKESRDSDGDTTYTNVFHGLFAVIEFNKTINTNIKIRKNTKTLFRKDEKLEMDSSEFEKNFDVYADNKIIAMQLLTSDTMQMLLDFKDESNLTPEITLRGNNLYIRFATGNMFEPKIFKNSLDKYTLKKYYDTINFTLDITEKFLKNVEETEI